MPVIRRSQLLSERRKRIEQVIQDYATYLERKAPCYVVSDRLLPHNKSEIVSAILVSIANSKWKFEIELLRGALATLAFYQDIGEHDNLARPDVVDYNIETVQGVREFKKAFVPYHDLQQQYEPLVDSDFAAFDRSAKRAISVNEHMWPSHRRLWEKVKSLGSGRRIPAEWVDFSG